VKILDSIPLVLELLVQYFKLKNKLAVYEVIERVDARLDSLDKKREALRKIPTSEAQREASKITDEIVEEKAKFELFWKDLSK
jgi:hypothetical protein